MPKKLYDFLKKLTLFKIKFGGLAVAETDAKLLIINDLSALTATANPPIQNHAWRTGELRNLLEIPLFIEDWGMFSPFASSPNMNLKKSTF